MAIVFVPEIESPSFAVRSITDPTAFNSIRPPEPAVDLSDRQDSSLDGLFIWICINCGLLLLGLHVYELLAWIMG